MASVTTTKTIYSINVGGNAFQFAAVDALLQADIGVSKNSPATLAVREGIQLAVYSLIFEGVKNNLWEFGDPAAGAAFMRELDLHQKAVAPRHVAEAPAVQGTFELVALEVAVGEQRERVRADVVDGVELAAQVAQRHVAAGDEHALHLAGRELGHGRDLVPLHTRPRAISPWRGQPTRWSLTMPTACMNA